MASLTAEQIIDLARAWGADAVGICDTTPFPEARETMQQHVANGKSGPLRFTYEDTTRATDARESFPWARSLVVLGHDYLGEAGAPATTGATVGRFATSDHYRPLRATTEKLAEHLRAVGHRTEILIDDNRLADRLPALRSGMGWRGRSTMVLVPGHGPWLLLGMVVTDAELSPGAPSDRSCGNCTACLPACPTGAISETGLDARRCLSTWLQTGGPMPLWIRHRVGRRIYGCDECLVACPPGNPRMRQDDLPGEELPFAGLLAASDSDLLERFSHWYIPRRQARHLRRNILVAAGNSREPASWVPIVEHLVHRSALVRAHAAWALARSGAPDAAAALTDRLEVETLPDVIDEIETALLMKRDPDSYRELVEADETRRTAGRSAPGGIAETVAQGHHRLGVDLADARLGDA